MICESTAQFFLWKHNLKLMTNKSKKKLVRHVEYNGDKRTTSIYTILGHKT